MAGSAVLDPNVLIDSLVGPVIDGLRGSLHPQFGVRAFRTSTVLRSWSGRMVGEGVTSDVITELSPQPLVMIWDVPKYGLSYRLEPCGLDEAGSLMVREVSLTYTLAELIGPKPLAGNQQWFIQIAEAHGQANNTRFFIHEKPPYTDRVTDMGWVLWLRSVDA